MFRRIFSKAIFILLTYLPELGIHPESQGTLQIFIQTDTSSGKQSVDQINSSFKCG